MSIVRVQSKANGGAGTTTVALTMDSTPTYGNNLIIVTSSLSAVGSRVSSIAQTGATWAKATEGVNNVTSGSECEIWYAENVSSASTSITVTYATSQPHGFIVVEYSGLKTSTSLDKVNSTSGNSSPTSTGTTATTTQANELWVGSLVVTGSVTFATTPTNSFSSVTTNVAAGAIALEFCEKIVSSTGTAATGDTYTVDAGNQWAGAVATFKDTSGGGGGVGVSTGLLMGV